MGTVVKTNLSVGKVERGQAIGPLRWMTHRDGVLFVVRMRRRRQMQREVTEATVEDAVVVKVGCCRRRRLPISSKECRLVLFVNRVKRPTKVSSHH